MIFCTYSLLLGQWCGGMCTKSLQLRIFFWSWNHFGNLSFRLSRRCAFAKTTYLYLISHCVHHSEIGLLYIDWKAGQDSKPSDFLGQQQISGGARPAPPPTYPFLCNQPEFQEDIWPPSHSNPTRIEVKVMAVRCWADSPKPVSFSFWGVFQNPAAFRSLEYPWYGYVKKQSQGSFVWRQVACIP